MFDLNNGALGFVFGKPVDQEDEHVLKAFSRDEKTWEKVNFAARILAGAIVIAGLFWLLPSVVAGFYSVFVVVLVAVGAAHLWVTHQPDNGRRVAMRGGLIVLDFAILTFAIMTANPFTEWSLPAPLRLEIGTFDFYFVLLVSTGLTYSACRMIWAGLVAMASWCVAVWWVWCQPETVTMLEHPIRSGSEWVEMQQNPMHVDLGVVVEQLAIIALVTAFLAIAVTRARRLVLRQVVLAGRRENLRRYFSDTLADRLERQNLPLDEADKRHVAVLFADLKGFTTWAEGREADDVFATLRDLMGRLTKNVFNNKGTLDKYTGDGLMASFGTPDVTPEDPADAIRCALAMQQSVAEWRQENAGADLQLMVGVHYGAVMVGDIGAGDRFEYAVLGDSVNVAARLEAATRKQRCLMLISQDTVEAAREKSADDIRGLLEEAGSWLIEDVPLNGREKRINAYAIGKGPAD